MINRLTLFLLLLMLSACAPAPSVVIPKSLNEASASRFGTVIASIGRSDDDRATARSLIYQKTGIREGGEFVFRNPGMGMGNTTVDFTYPGGGEGALAIAKLPAGEYELVNVDFFENHGQMGTKSFSAREPFSIKFHLGEGETVYLGEYMGHRLVGKNMFYITISVGGYFVVSDRLERDLQLAAQKGHVVPIESVTNKTQDVLSAGVPVLRGERVVQ